MPPGLRRTGSCMMKPELAVFVEQLCIHFDAQVPMPERMNIVFEDVKHIPGAALAEIGRHIRTDPDQKLFPKNLSGAMIKAFETVKRPQVITTEQPNFTPPTPEQLEANRKRAEYWLPRIIGQASSIKAPYLREDSQRTRRARR